MEWKTHYQSPNTKDPAVSPNIIARFTSWQAYITVDLPPDSSAQILCMTPCHAISNGQTRPLGKFTKTETPNVSSQCLSDMLGVNMKMVITHVHPLLPSYSSHSISIALITI
jgi:hypothetical protein